MDAGLTAGPEGSRRRPALGAVRPRDRLRAHRPGAPRAAAGARLSLLRTATLGSWDRRRFRPSVLLDGEGEDRLGGRLAARAVLLQPGTVRVGDVPEELP